MPASGPPSRGARVHPRPCQGNQPWLRSSAAPGLVLATQRLGSITGRGTDVPLVRHQHVLGPREQGEDQSRAPDHVHEPGAEVPPGRRPDRAGDRDEGGPEGPDREARPPGLRPRQHGHDRRGLDGREEHPRCHRFRRRRREARAPRPAGSRPDPAHRPRRRRPPARPGRVLARRVREGNLRAALRLRRRGRRRQRRPAEAQGARGHLRAPGSGGADLRPGEEVD